MKLDIMVLVETFFDLNQQNIYFSNSLIFKVLYMYLIKLWVEFQPLLPQVLTS